MLAKKFGYMQAELGHVKKRMWVQRYPHNDKLQLLVLQAFDAMQELRLHVHYMVYVSKFADDPERPAKP